MVSIFTTNGKPFFPLGGQVHNSSGYSLGHRDHLVRVGVLFDQGERSGQAVETLDHWQRSRLDRAIRRQQAFDAEHGITASALDGDGGEQINRIRQAPARFGDKQRVIRAVVSRRDLAVKIRGLNVNVRGNPIDVGRQPFPQVEHPGHGPAGRIIDAGQPPAIFCQPDIDVHRQSVSGFTGFSDSVDVTRDTPGGEKFASPQAKHLFPTACLFRPAGLPCIFNRVRARGQEGEDQVRRHSGGELFLGQRGMVTDGAENARLIFDLHGDDGVRIAVKILHVAHQAIEGAAIRFPVGAAVGR